MQKREKVIVAVAAVALLYFVIDLFAVSEDSAKDSPENLSKECEAFLTRGNATLGAVKSSPELFRRITLLEGVEDGKNPFIRDWLDKEAAAEDELPGNKPERAVRYTGYIESAGNSLVVINGQEYAVNQVIDGTDFIIKKVSKSCIVLEPRNPTESEEGTITVAKEVQDDVFKP